MTTFQAEEGLYTDEGISFTPIPYIDNQPVLDLCDMNPDLSARQQASTMKVVYS